VDQRVGLATVQVVFIKQRRVDQEQTPEDLAEREVVTVVMLKRKEHADDHPAKDDGVEDKAFPSFGCHVLFFLTCVVSRLVGRCEMVGDLGGLVALDVLKLRREACEGARSEERVGGRKDEVFPVGIDLDEARCCGGDVLIVAAQKLQA
jgi:hypothetical protein